MADKPGPPFCANGIRYRQTILVNAVIGSPLGWANTTYESIGGQASAIATTGEQVYAAPPMIRFLLISVAYLILAICLVQNGNPRDGLPAKT